MGKIFQSLTFVGALAASDLAMAQPVPGWQVNWGAVGVPIGPWANALIGLALVAVAYAFLRKRAGAGLMALGAAVLVGSLVLNTDKIAQAIPVTVDTISTPSGSATYYCDAGHPVGHVLGTTVAGGVTLTVIPVGDHTGFVPVPSECAIGTHLNPGDFCNLSCPVL